MGSAHSKKSHGEHIFGNGVDTAYNIPVWIADASLKAMRFPVPITVHWPGLCPARLEVLDHACVFDMVFPGGFPVKLYIGASECRELLAVSAKDSPDASTTVQAFVVDNDRTPGTEYLMPIKTRFEWNTAKGGLVKVPDTATVSATCVPGGVKWNFVLPQVAEFSIGAEFTLANSERGMIRGLFVKDGAVAKQEPGWWGEIDFTKDEVRVSRNALHGRWGHWDRQAEFVTEMARPMNKRGMPFGKEAPGGDVYQQKDFSGYIVGTRAKVAADALASGESVSAETLAVLTALEAMHVTTAADAGAGAATATDA
jgi:hypothetical protein